MKQFELRYLDRLDAVMRTRLYLAQDDLAALTEARQSSVENTVEVWEGMRKVARVKKGNAALTADDRFAG